MELGVQSWIVDRQKTRCSDGTMQVKCNDEKICDVKRFFLGEKIFLKVGWWNIIVHRIPGPIGLNTRGSRSEVSMGAGVYI